MLLRSSGGDSAPLPHCEELAVEITIFLGVKTLRPRLASLPRCSGITAVFFYLGMEDRDASSFFLKFIQSVRHLAARPRGASREKHLGGDKQEGSARARGSSALVRVRFDLNNFVTGIKRSWSRE